MLNRLLAASALLGALSGCSVSKMIDTVEIPSVASIGGASAKADDAERLDTIAFADAYCRGDGEAALVATRTLVATDGANPKVQLVHGMALDLAGRGVTAYRVLEPLAAKDHPMPASLKCNADFVYSGSVSEVAQRRLFEIKTKLTALGMAFPPPPLAQATASAKEVYMLAARAPTRLDSEPPPAERPEASVSAAVPSGAPPAPAMTANARPASAGKAAAADIFVHLGSYRSMKTLDKGWQSLKRRFAAPLKSREKSVQKVDLGKKKGAYLRLGIAVADDATAKRLCREIKAGGQYCAVMPSAKG